MLIVSLLIFFLLGLLFGSFFNVVGLRVPMGESIIHPPSHCPNCETRLRASQLIPVLSYLISRGRCRTCRMTISPIYPLMELATGVGFALVFSVYGPSWETLAGVCFVSLLAIITVSDIRYRLIPDKVVFTFLALFLILRFLVHPTQPFWLHLLGMTVGFCLFLLLAVLYKGGVGGGDIKLYAVIGLFLGVKLLVLGVFLSSLLGTVYGIFLMIRRRADRKTAIPFGPFIALGSFLAYLYGQELISWYMHFYV